MTNRAGPVAEQRSRLSAMFEHQAAGGIVLLAAAALALLLDNTGLGWASDFLLDTPFGVRLGALRLEKPLLLWVNDGLMAIYFFLVGLEIKKEMASGALSTVSLALLPAVAALGGMVVPALIYVAFNAGDAAALKGWAIPAATDIAFALGVLALAGPRVPPSLKVFLLALAVLDDLGAIIIIAVFYTSELSVLSLGLALAGVSVLFALNQANVQRFAPYLLVGVFVWVCVLKSGVHATLAGVAVALMVPLSGGADGEEPLAERLMHELHPWTTFLVAPLFAFANAGVSLAGLSANVLAQPIPLGIALGLFLGKPIGILGGVWAMVQVGTARLPEGATWMHILGVAMLGGIGFTMSLFIGMLAFPEPAMAMPLRVGVLTGSLLSAVGGYLVLRVASR